MEVPCVPSYIEDMPPVSRPTRGTDIVICEPIRTPVGAFGGVFANTTVTDLAATVLSELVTRTGLSEGDVDDVILGQCYPNGEAPALGRSAALDPGLGTGVPGMQKTGKESGRERVGTTGS